jgi:hypothetical protein
MSIFNQPVRPLTLSATPVIDRRKLAAFGIVNYSFIIPVFSESAPTWLGASYTTVEFPCVASSGFSFIALLGQPTTPNFCLAVRSGNNRYKFWEGVGELLNAPLYNGESIATSFALEVWTAQDEPITSISSQIELVTSLRRFATASSEAVTENLGVSDTLTGSSLILTFA